MTDKVYEEYVCNESPLIGKFVKIILNGRGFLGLCEVEILGRLLWGESVQIFLQKQILHLSEQSQKRYEN